MNIGILTNTFAQLTFEQTLDTLVEHDLRHVQFDLNCAGLPSMPDALDAADAQRIGSALGDHGIAMAALSGTFNMIHPDPAERALGLARLEVLAKACADLGTQVITLCTGTRDRESMWRFHPDNAKDDAWRDLVGTMAAAATIAEAHNVTLAFEPEVNNTVDSARKARKLLDTIASPRLKVVMDGANIFHTGELPHMREILDEAFELLGDDIALAHAKDLDHDGDAGHLPAGHGMLDYGQYLALLNRSRYVGPIILHGLSEAHIDGCVRFLRKSSL